MGVTALLPDRVAQLRQGFPIVDAFCAFDPVLADNLNRQAPPHDPVCLQYHVLYLRTRAM